ncbi:hypothetical protein NQ315_009787 [Exocentrus adspersus]|uniref:KxDL domain-containing protein n=1 Tax=Exocentrus adspersus TaxID=1586481 RepID=A0AAV8WIC5_9CUCU|nr:hypothetical protein NQ315_009787 [Exocentrus adspersus]
MEETKGTPESDFSIECFQNYTAPEVFIQGLAGIVDQQDVEAMIRAQKQMLQRFEKTNEMLTNCNALSASRLKTMGPEFKKHIQLLLETKKRLGLPIKSKLSSQYPEAYTEAVRSSFAEECEEDEAGTSNSHQKTVNDEGNRRSLHINSDKVENLESNRRASK